MYARLVEHKVEKLLLAVERPSEVSYLALAFLLLQIVEKAILYEAVVICVSVAQIVQQQIVNVVCLQLFQ